MKDNYNNIKDELNKVEVQMLFLRMMITNVELYTRVMNIMNVNNFDKSLRPAVEFIINHCKDYNAMPNPLQIKATTGIEVETITELSDGHYEWFLHEFEIFTRQEEITRAIYKSVDLLDNKETKNWSLIENLIKNAVQISLQRDMGTDYFADPRGRLLGLKSNNGQISSGWPTLDNKLYGGFNRGELQIFAGGSGSGKSLIMQNLSVNWLLAGINGAYITLELNEGLCAHRIDAMMTDTPSREIFKELDTVEMKIKMLSKKTGKFRIKYLPAQSNVNDVRAYVKELEIQTGVKVDFLCIDYLDLLMPVGAKVSPSDLFVKDKYVSEELRNLAKELNVLLVTASQLNRTAVDEIEFDHSHISGGISKINTADNVFGIFTSRHMRERGQYQLQLMKTRSSSGVGQKIELEFNVETLRITDPDLEDKAKYVQQPSANELMKQIKPNLTLNDKVHEVVDPINKKITADIQSTRLKSLLNTLTNKK